MKVGLSFSKSIPLWVLFFY